MCNTCYDMKDNGRFFKKKSEIHIYRYIVTKCLAHYNFTPSSSKGSASQLS